MIMSSLNAENREGTRDRIMRLLIKQEHTIESLADALGITRNAVRSQIALLEREGVVEVRGAVKGRRRPAALYGIRAGADVHLSRAYPVMLSSLTQVLAKRLSNVEFRGVMRDLGRQVAHSAPQSSGDARDRVKGALTFLKALGSAAEVSEADGTMTVTGSGCPFSAAVSADSRSCLAMETLLKKLTGLPVAERCVHGEHPSCRFEIQLT